MSSSDRHEPSNERDVLADAFRAVRSDYDGEREDADLTLQRALFKTRVQKRRQRITRWTLLPAAAVLVASTAWAGASGRLAAVSTMLESIYEGRDRPEAKPAIQAAGAPSPGVVVSPAANQDAPPDPPVEPVTSEPPSVEPPPAEVPSPERAASVVTPRLAIPPVPSAARVAVVPSSETTARVASGPAAKPAFEALAAPPTQAAPPTPVAPPTQAAPPTPAPPPAPSASANDPHAALFAEAHRVHFGDRDPARALAAWDRYLAAAPDGRFAPEARYNRALSLVRLGRKSEAQQELAAFANGRYGDYRRAEAKALLEAFAGTAP